MDIPSQLNTFFMIVSLVLGLMVGSFCNVCICRWPAGESVIRPRSRCPKCGNAIAWYDNVPLLSWLLLGAKCRNCGTPISWLYPMVEGVTGLLFLLMYARFGFTFATPVYMFFCAGLVIVTFVDLREWIIPNEVTFSGIIAGLLLALLGTAYPEASNLRVTSVVDAFAGIVLGGGILYLLDKLTLLILKKPGMGFGDVKLLAMIGAFIGWKGVIGTLMLACIVGSVVGLSLIIVDKLRRAATPAPGAAAEAGENKGEEEALPGHYIPFGPYLALAGLIYLCFGPELIAFYLAVIQPPPMDVLDPQFLPSR